MADINAAPQQSAEISVITVGIFMHTRFRDMRESAANY
jgi:hypothetical protein